VQFEDGLGVMIKMRCIDGKKISFPFGGTLLVSCNEAIAGEALERGQKSWLEPDWSPGSKNGRMRLTRSDDKTKKNPKRQPEFVTQSPNHTNP